MSEGLNNIDFQLFVGIADDIHRIANAIAPEETSENTVFSQIAAAWIAASKHLEDVLNDGSLHAFDKSMALRDLINRWRVLSEEYVKKQSELDQQKATKNVEVSKM